MALVHHRAGGLVRRAALPYCSRTAARRGVACSVAAPEKAPASPPAPPKKDKAPVSPAVLGENDWAGLIPTEFSPTSKLDEELRQHVIEMGELAEVTYDALITEPTSKRCYQPRWPKDQLLKNCLGEKHRITQAYKVRELIYADTGKSTLFVGSQRAKESNEAVKKAAKTLGEDGAEKLYGEDSDTVRAWQGYMVTNSSGAPKDVVFAWRGTIFGSEWANDLLGDKLTPWSELNVKEYNDKLQKPPVTSKAASKAPGAVKPAGVKEGGHDHKEHKHEDTKHNDRDPACPPNDANDVEVHNGFLAAYTTNCPLEDGINNEAVVGGDATPSPVQLVRQYLIQLIKEAGKDQIRTICTTGHSLGAALCIVNAFHLGCLLHNDDEITGLLTTYGYARPPRVTAFAFAPPRVGNPPFAEAAAKLGVKVLRICNMGDLVPLTPGIVQSGTGLFDNLHGFPEVERAALVTDKAAQRTADIELANKLLQTYNPKGYPHGWSSGLSRVLHPLPLLNTWTYVDYGPVLPLCGGMQRQQLKNSKISRVDVVQTLAGLITAGLIKSGIPSGVVGPLGMRHNLEGTLWLAASQHRGDNSPADEQEEAFMYRDVALCNKSEDAVELLLALKYNIPARWWSPEPNRGMRAYDDEDDTLKGAANCKGRKWIEGP